MKYRLLFLLAASAPLLPGVAPAQQVSGYDYERTTVGPGGGVFVGQRSSRTVAGPFGAATGTSRSGSYVAPGGATVEYAQRSGAVVGPLGGGRVSSASYVHAESADRGLTYSRHSSRSSPVGPAGGSMFVGQRSTAAVAGPFGTATGVSRSGSYVAPGGATVEYAQRSGAVVGPLGGGRVSSASYVHAESADRGITYSRYSRSSSAIGPAGGVAVGRTTAAAVGPFGAVGYRRSW